jgi:pyruvate formate lyase activating enzyme
MKGLIFSVKRYSIHDGPGIRVTFFMKGCPLSCLWCHNPEGISPVITSIADTRRMGDKEFTRTAEAGKYYSIEEILEILARERLFFQQSGGGVTFSGGEPMVQPEFVREALKASGENGYHTAVDTSGYCRESDLREIVPFTDLFLYDIKHLDERKHVQFTGVSNRIILENFRMLNESAKNIIVRIPVVPGVNDDPEHLASLRQFLIKSVRSNTLGLSLLPFHRTGASKYGKLGLSYRMTGTEPPSRERMNELKAYFSETGLKVKIGG